VFLTKDILSGDKIICAPFSSSAKMALRFTAMSFVETEPYILAFFGVTRSVDFIDVTAEVDSDGDIFFGVVMVIGVR
jgi:hypothetical protein